MWTLVKARGLGGNCSGDSGDHLRNLAPTQTQPGLRNRY